MSKAFQELWSHRDGGRRNIVYACPSDCTWYGIHNLRPPKLWDCRFNSCLVHDCMSVFSVFCSMRSGTLIELISHIRIPV
jgi:hypothetical protein